MEIILQYIYVWLATIMPIRLNLDYLKFEFPSSPEFLIKHFLNKIHWRFTHLKFESHNLFCTNSVNFLLKIFHHFYLLSPLLIKHLQVSFGQCLVKSIHKQITSKLLKPQTRPHEKLIKLKLFFAHLSSRHWNSDAKHLNDLFELFSRYLWRKSWLRALSR